MFHEMDQWLKPFHESLPICWFKQVWVFLFLWKSLPLHRKWCIISLRQKKNRIPTDSHFQTESKVRRFRDVDLLAVPPSLHPVACSLPPPFLPRLLFSLLSRRVSAVGAPQSLIVGLHSNLCWITQAWVALAAQCRASASFSTFYSLSSRSAQSSLCSFSTISFLFFDFIASLYFSGSTYL